jgi:hypothetical protein
MSALGVIRGHCKASDPYPLCPRKQTPVGHRGMSVKCQHQTLAPLFEFTESGCLYLHPRQWHDLDDFYPCARHLQMGMVCREPIYDLRVEYPPTKYPGHCPGFILSRLYFATPQAMRAPPPPKGAGWSE